MNSKIKLHGFNNLTKSLSFNIYDVCWTRSATERRAYIEYIDEEYNSDRLTRVLLEVCQIIGATVLNIARQDYEPEGSSVAILIAETPVVATDAASFQQTVLGHLDKSHITVHTYPETHPGNDISTFRVDIDVSTCGVISPLKALNHLIGSFDSDIVIMDYRVRGFTRDIGGGKHFIDHDIHSIQDFINEQTLSSYQRIDVNIYEENIFHTKMLLRDFDLQQHLFETTIDDLTEAERERISGSLMAEMEGIFYGKG